jgi:hypothetical protein
MSRCFRRLKARSPGRRRWALPVARPRRLMGEGPAREHKRGLQAGLVARSRDDTSRTSRARRRHRPAPTPISVVTEGDVGARERRDALELVTSLSHAAPRSVLKRASCFASCMIRRWNGQQSQRRYST